MCFASVTNVNTVKKLTQRNRTDRISSLLHSACELSCSVFRLFYLPFIALVVYFYSQESDGSLVSGICSSRSHRLQMFAYSPFRLESRDDPNGLPDAARSALAFCRFLQDERIPEFAKRASLRIFSSRRYACKQSCIVLHPRRKCIFQRMHMPFP